MAERERSKTRIVVAIASIVAGVLAFAPAATASPVADTAALRAAVSAVNSSNAGGDTIELLGGHTYVFDGAQCAVSADDEDANATGDLDVFRTQALEIFTAAGQPPARLEMACSPGQRLIEVRPRGTGDPSPLTLRNVVIANGHAPADESGGGLASVGPVTLDQVGFEDNLAGDGLPGDSGQPDGGLGGSGGAVAADGALAISDSSFTGNQTGTGGAGFSFSSCDAAPLSGGIGGRGGSGGAVISFVGLTIVRSTFSGNATGDGGDGGDGQCGEDSTAGIPGAEGGAGGHGGRGGAAACFCDEPMIVQTTTMSTNSSGDGGNGGAGGAGGDGTSGDGGAGGAGGAGGGASSAISGGAISYFGNVGDSSTLQIENSTLDANSSGAAGDGGPGGAGGAGTGAGGAGGDGGDGGHGQFAGAVSALLPTSTTPAATIVHSTITDNGSGGAAGSAGSGGPGGSGSPAGATGAAGAPGSAGGGSTALDGTWESEASVIATPEGSTSTDCHFPPSASADSFETSGSCLFGNTALYSDLELGPLADNGGPTETRAPALTSPLVDAATGGAAAVDQRGVPRPQGAAADAGAVEVQKITIEVTNTPSATSVAPGAVVTFTFTVTNTGPHSPAPGVAVTNPGCQGPISGPSGDANSNGVLDPGETFSYTCTATASAPGPLTNTATIAVTDALGATISDSATATVAVNTKPPDTTPPDTKITKAPNKITREHLAKFKFTTEPGAGFQCSLDGKKFKPCTSPYRARVEYGKHRFAVRAIDRAGNIDPTPATWKWKVVRECSHGHGHGHGHGGHGHHRPLARSGSGC